MGSGMVDASPLGWAEAAAASVAARPGPFAAPGPVDAVVETHVSVVVFIDGMAYKVKKAVVTPYVDQSTASARHRACAQEVALNRRLAPDVYLGVADVLDDGGAVVDHAVVMRRLPATRRLSTLAVNGEALAPEIDAIARRLAAFHATASRSPVIERAGEPQALRRLWHDNLTELAGLGGDAVTVERIRRLALGYLDGRGPLLAERVTSGRIVDGHGDLLADDIFCLDDGPRLLDCLEFDARFRHGDVLLDVAFLAMDLEHLGRPDLAGRLLRAYREHSGETHPVSLEHHYVAYRAGVRAKIDALKAASGVAGADAAARAHVAQCLGHLQAAEVRLVVVGGLPGTGKSTVSAALAEEIDATVLRSDVVRKEITGAGPGPAAAPFGEGIYATDFTTATYVELLRRAEVALGRGQSVVLDASWANGRWRAKAAEVARRTSSRHVELCCEASASVTQRRLGERAARGADPSDADARIAAAMAPSFEAWPTATVVDTSAGSRPAAVEVARGLR